MLLAIFALLVISGVAAALLLMAGMESAIAGNYRNSTQAFYAGFAGLEEGRGRLWPGNPNALGNFIAPPGGTLALGQVRYIINAPAGVAVQPTNLVNTNPYADFEYQQEWGIPVTGAAVQFTNSVATAALPGVPGPRYGWIRITPKTERSAGTDIDGNGILDNAIPVFYDGTNQNLTGTGRQVLRITSFSLQANGSKRILQYDVSAVVFNLSFPSAITFDGTGSALFPANSNVYNVDGNDNASCGIPPQPARPAIGTVTPGDDAAITAAIPKNRVSHYTGVGPAPDVEDVAATLPPMYQTVASLQALVQTISANADQVIQGPASSLPSYGTAAAPTITVVNGDLSLGPISGYGILVVTGNVSFQGATSWKGIVLVIGTGNMTVSGGGNGQFNGAVFLAKTLGPGGVPLASPGATLLDWAGGGGNGVFYDSCAINNAQNNVVYKTLAFHEVAQ